MPHEKHKLTELEQIHDLMGTPPPRNFSNILTVHRPHMPSQPNDVTAALVPSCLLLPHTLHPLRVLFLSLPSPPRLPVAGAQVATPEGARGSPVGGHGDVSAGGRRGP